MIAEWSGKYIGIPFEDHGRDVDVSLDCLGLMYAIYRYEYGIELPDYNNYGKADFSGTIEKQFMDGITDWIRIDKPEVGCMVMLNIGGHPVHLGVCIGDNKFIHTCEGVDTAIDKLNGVRWLGRVEGYYRYLSR